MVRTRQWWRAKAGYLISLLTCYLAIHSINVLQGAKLLALALLAIFGIGSLGHIINDWCDIDDDRKAKKSNTLEFVATPIKWLMLFTTVVLGHLPWLIGFVPTKEIFILLAIESGLFVLYSMPPCKFKRIPVVAICLDSLYAFVIPSLFLWFSFASSTKAETDNWLVLSMVGCAFPMGLRHVLLHHIADMNNDQLSNTPNLANKFGIGAILRLIRGILIPAEMLFHLAFLVQLYRIDPFVGLPLLVFYLLIAVFVIIDKLPYLSMGLAKLPLDRYYTRLLGVFSLTFLSFSEPAYLFILAIFLLMFTDLSQHPLGPYITQIVRSRTWSAGSYLVNWGVYYFRKWILNWPEEKNWGRHYSKHLRDIELGQKPAIAMFNESYNRFSSEYLVNKFSPLDHRLYFYHGMPRPIIEAGEGNLMGKNETLRRLKYALLNFLNADITDHENEQIAKSILRKKVELMVAHSAATGYELIDMVHRTGIPLMVIFHQADHLLHDRESDNVRRNLALFKQAKCVVGTSVEICNTLYEAGCPENKIAHLPNFLDPGLFQLESHGSGGHVFISVGRYTSTRAPYLLLLSFRDVVAQLPDAQLLILGLEMEDDVTEVCRVMTHALGLDAHVKFLYNCSYEDVLQAMKSADVFVQHFVTPTVNGKQEGTPLAVMMSMAMGLPVVTSGNGGVANLIIDGESGMVVNEYDYHAMAAKMIVMATDNSLRSKVKTQAKTAIRNHSSIRSGIDLFSDLVRQCVQAVPRK